MFGVRLCPASLECFLAVFSLRVLAIGMFRSMIETVPAPDHDYTKGVQEDRLLARRYAGGTRRGDVHS